MSNNFIVRQLSRKPERRYDLFIATNGYEQRATYIAANIQPHARLRAAIGFSSDHIFHYDQNAEWFISNMFPFANVSDDQFGSFVTKLIDQAIVEADENTVSIAIDISSATRHRLAVILKILESTANKRPLSVDFYYALAEFSPPPLTVQANTHVGPVLPSFSGWWNKPERSVAALVGLGYEQNKALGAVEHLQASNIFVFTPISSIQPYTPAVEAANQTLSAFVADENKFTYRVNHPLETFVTLESFAFGVTREQNLVILPFGPKIFALSAMLVGMLNPEVAVWRVSGGEDRVDRKACGDVFGLNVLFGVGDEAP